MKKNSGLTPAEEISQIRKKLKHFTLDRQTTAWLDTGNKRLNAVLGSAEFGIPFGKMIELFGPESHGKTMLALLLAALAQGSGAKVAWVDLENSFDRAWVEAQGLKYDEVALFQPQVGRFGSEKEVRLQTSEELLEEVEQWIALRHDEDPAIQLLVVVDSIAAILTEDEAAGGLTNQNMRTNSSLAMFLSKLLRRWVGMAASYNTMMIFINQIRTTPGAWGNPEYSTGGKALKFYCSIRATVRRVKGGRMMQGRTVGGLRGIVRNIKNKSGGGSVEGAEVGFETKFGKRAWRFPSVQDVKKESGEAE